MLTICRHPALRAALKELGYNDTYHMMSASVENPPDCLLWQDAFAAKFEGKGKFGREQWDQLLGHCQVRILQTLNRDTLLTQFPSGCM
jgi:Sulfotransferase domain